MTREDFPALFQKRGYKVGVEVGVQRGEFAAKILRGWDGALVVVDPWRHMPDYKDIANVSDEEQEAIYHTAMVAMMAAGRDRFFVCRMTSLAAAAEQKIIPVYERFDFVYLDADHSYEAVKADIAAWLPLISKGGIIAGHDWIPDGEYPWGTFGVQKAVKEAFDESRINVTNEEGGLAPSWWVEL